MDWTCNERLVTQTTRDIPLTLWTTLTSRAGRWLRKLLRDFSNSNFSDFCVQEDTADLLDRSNNQYPSIKMNEWRNITRFSLMKIDWGFLGAVSYTHLQMPNGRVKKTENSLRFSNECYFNKTKIIIATKNKITWESRTMLMDGKWIEHVTNGL